jgi:hypothetical protein
MTLSLIVVIESYAAFCFARESPQSNQFGSLRRENHPAPSSCGHIAVQSRSIHLEQRRNILMADDESPRHG